MTIITIVGILNSEDNYKLTNWNCGMHLDDNSVETITRACELKGFTCKKILKIVNGVATVEVV